MYATVLDKRIRAITEGKVLKEQGTFRSKRSCIDQIFTVGQLEEKVIGKNKTVRMVCVDLEKAFDRVDRELLGQVLERYRARERLRKLWSHCIYKVKHVYEYRGRIQNGLRS